MHETEAALWKPPSTQTVVENDLDTLRAVPLFKGLSDADLKRVMKLLHVREYQPDEVVFRAGQTGAGMYIIQHGEVEIVMRREDGEELSLVTLRAPQFFGELALLESMPRSATSVVRKKAVLLGLFQSDLEQLVSRNSQLGARVLWNLARVTSSRLRELSESVRAGAAPRPSAPIRATTAENGG